MDAFVTAVLASVQLKQGPKAAMALARTFDEAAREHPQLARGYRPLLDTLPEGTR